MEGHPESDDARLLKEEYQIWKKNTPYLYGTGRLCFCISRIADKTRSQSLTTLQICSSPRSLLGPA